MTSQTETRQEAASALGSIAESFASKELSDQEKKRIAETIERDPQAQSAVKAIAGSLEGQPENIKYSPATGKRYSGELEYDPETGVKLLPLEP